jgi:hypothetical protein
MKIALIGTSPIMLILASLLNKNNLVTIYDEKKIVGGAWGLRRYNNYNIARQTNVIVPNRYKEDNQNVEFLNKYLKKKFKITVKVDKKKNFPAAYKPKKYYIYNVERILNIHKKFKVIQKKINSISFQKNNKVSVNGKKYDRVYVPTFLGLDYFKINGKKNYIPKKIIVSKHIFAVFKKDIFENLSYSENYNEYFDRIQITREKKIFFTARIRKSHKKKRAIELLKKSNLFSKQNLIFHDVMRYKNYHRDLDQERKLKQTIKNTNIIHINTRQFLEGFIDLRKKFKLS